MKNITKILIVMFFPVVLTSCLSKQGPEKFYFGSYSDAEKFYNAGQYQEAINQYSAYIDENPDGNLAVIATYYSAKSYAALGQLDKARELYQAIQANHPDLIWAKFAETQLKDLELESSSKKS
ncbi:MAG: tetratricopeptide repeat protein [Candidatus Omnitrophica bacterium]|nr:tetratricopeptide repeat protein [Candidatus Omnitrophota bacterium]